MRVVQSLTQVANSIDGVAQDLQSNPTATLIQLLSFTSSTSVQELLAELYSLFPALSLYDSQKIAALFYSLVCHYPIPLNEI